MPISQFDLIVVGSGSGGFGAALAAARLGVRVLLVEKSDSLGGNAARGGVNNWEPGVGGTGIPFDLFRRLNKIPNAIGIYSYGRHYKWQGKDVDPKFPGGELLIDPTRSYLDSLRCFGGPAFADAEAFGRKHWHGVPFEPDFYSAEMEKMLVETGHCTIWKSTAFTDVNVDGSRLCSLRLTNGDTVDADFFVDATADILLARRLHCRTSLGQESRELYDEPSAPRSPNDRLNGCTLIYRISRKGKATRGIDPLPASVPSPCWWADEYPIAVYTQYPIGDFNVNALPVMAGREAYEMGYERAYAECQRRILAHWHHVQLVFPEFQDFRISWVAPGLGIREGPRLIGRYILTEHDLIAGISDQTHEDIITIADHPRDTHGADTGRAGTSELTEPYGVPFRCLLPVEIDNLAVACRGASFSSVAASSCRLSRTMMQLGQAAGTAVALATKDHLSSLATVSPSVLRASLEIQHVEISWPRSPEMLRHLSEENN